MKIKQLGNGGGFDFNMTNSSFLINFGSNSMLFDCGYNIMQRLTSDSSIDLEDINLVYISHMDEDHVGNLKMFIYWRYFKYNKITDIFCHSSILEDIKSYLKDMESELIGCSSVYSHMYNINTIRTDEIHLPYGFSIEATRCNHGDISTHGVIIRSLTKSIFISGDTKASKYIEDISKNCDLIFHDYSHWDYVTRNVHTCKTDFELEYSEEYRNKVIKYHTGDLDFKKDWYTL